ncbi:MAG: CsgG/HfaB family protein [Candidatus Omnitrophica bacterium]|nr:CsgG/HfaB family protein [Candidatus Omnitrophota bacterium]MCM8802932.1 CsgG/HfaB family protein [Candidatus Omnitrophota bacterium]
MRKIYILIFPSLIISLFCQVKTEVKTGQTTVEEIIKYEGPKARIAISRFDVKAPKAIWEMGNGIRDMLVDALFKTGKFIVVEKDAIKDLEEEFKFAETGWTKKELEKGTFEVADIVVVGAITAFEPHAEGTGGGGFVIPTPFGFGIGVKKEEAYIQAVIRLVDVRTRRIINSTTVEGKASKSKVGVAGGTGIGGVILGGGFEKYKNTPTEEAVMIMINNAVNEISRLVPENYYRYGSKENEKKYKNEPDGFRGIKWTTYNTQVPNLKLIKEDANSKEYIKTDDNMYIGKAKLEKITYRFYKDQFESVLIETKGKENFENLKTITLERFGEGKKIGENEWIWEGQITTIYLKYQQGEEKGILKMVSEEMKKKIEADIGF